MATPFDFNQLLQDPTFQFGASLFGNARQPGAAQSAFGQMAKVQQFKATQKQQQEELDQRKKWQEDQANRMRQQNVEDALRTGILDASEKRKQDLFERQTKMQDTFMQQLQGLIGGGGGQPAPQAPQAPSPEAPSGPQSQNGGGPMDKVANFASQYGEAAQQAAQRLGVDPRLVLSQWGNETGWGEHIIPGTNNLGNIKGPNGVMATDNATGSQDSYAKFADPNAFADHYANLISSRYPAAMGVGSDAAAFGTALKRGGYAEDPNYPRKIQIANALLQRVAAQQPQGQSQAQAGGQGAPINAGNSMPNRGLDVARLAAGAGVVGLPGAAQVAELGKMMAPQNVPAGSYTRDPTTGAMQYNQDPMETGRLAQGAQRIGIDQRRADIEQKRNDYEMGGHPGQLPQKALDNIISQNYEKANIEINKSHETYKELPNQLAFIDRAQKDVAGLLAHRNTMTPVGYASAQKLFLLKAFSNTFGRDAPKDVVNAEDFNAAMGRLWAGAVRQVDSNVTERQQKTIAGTFGTLQNDPGALTKILAETKISFTKQAQRHNKAVAQFQKSVGQPDPYSRYLDTGETTPAGTHIGEEEDGHTYLGGPVNASTSWSK